MLPSSVMTIKARQEVLDFPGVVVKTITTDPFKFLWQSSLNTDDNKSTTTNLKLKFSVLSDHTHARLHTHMHTQLSTAWLLRNHNAAKSPRSQDALWVRVTVKVKSLPEVMTQDVTSQHWSCRVWQQHRCCGGLPHQKGYLGDDSLIAVNTLARGYLSPECLNIFPYKYF